VRHFRLSSITIELILLFVATFAILEVVSLGYRSVSQAENLASLEAIRIADNIAVVTSLIEKTPPEERSAAVGNFKGSDLYVSLDVEPWRRAGSDQNSETSHLRSLLTKVMPQLAPTDILVGYRRLESGTPTQGSVELATSWKKAGPFPAPVDDIIDELASGPTLLVSVRLNDGTWLNFLAAYVESIDFWPLRSIVILSLAVIGTVALSIWAIRRLTSPIREFAAAATRLGIDVNATPIEEHGPSDVRAAIQAFNGMQNKLRRFVEDRTQMLAAVSHDLRTPITRLRLRAECLKDRTQCAKFLEDLSEMEDMIAGILSFAKEDALSEPTIPVDLVATIQSICDEFADRGFNVSFAGGARLPYPCRRVSIRRCLTNLIGNAVKYGQQPELSIDVTGREIMIHVDDRGPGIPDELREEAFRPFYRLEGSRSRDSGGSGLGLTVARNVARAHGGDVVLSGRAEGGLRATIVLPQNDVPFSPQWTGIPEQKLMTGAGTQNGRP
jgi:signal transduction histidine kinase